ncbi:aminotransferase class III-fold pyridoxal phosphate-dependent enzyme [Poritiphilus flavus]|uniref:Aminotransferase class III-fold pyridoxal phosphate-dependent enzyme n=1 Tax=Poritiphilus flavus TaxID=2697053 RepID=A0A6L9EEP1_9FLAO|nr:aminotransferase class III-fold pyridoxal phosphate-dependent enzyme [Poritiphilus flavus]NAS13123.1 aminotransferase class III-fold pyridoxal phosphate-dependent enzyme [Poritiphilus flavus]
MEIKEIIEGFFGYKVTSVSQLEGYDSINYKIVCSKGSFVLKQYPDSEETRGLLKAENEVLQTLSTLPYDFPEPELTRDQQAIFEKGDCLFRLLSYVEGTFLGDVSHEEELLHSFGRFLAEMDNALLDCKQAEILAKETRWDLKHFGINRPYLNYIEDAGNRNLVDYFYLQYEQQVLPISHRLRKKIIHNDANDWNVLTRENRVSGIIDFGDMCHSWLINELAVALTYVMMHKTRPLEIASSVIAAYQQVLPLEEVELEVLYFLIGARLATSVCNSAKTKLDKPDSEYITISEKPAWELLRKWLEIGPIAAENAFKKVCGWEIEVTPIEKQLDQRHLYFSDSLSLSYRNPIQMKRSAFQYMYDIHGNSFLDAYNNIMLAGHCHPKVVRAGQRAMSVLNTNTRYLYDSLYRYTEKLLNLFPDSLNKIFFVNSGSAASDLAIRLARTHTRKNKIMVLQDGYHGNTATGIQISPYKYHKLDKEYHNPDILECELPKAFNSGYEEAEAGAYFAKRSVELLQKNQGEIAAFIAEPIVGCGGQVPLAKGYLQTVYPEVRSQGGVCISDEVQVGFGRLGDHFWGFEMHEVVPDIVILGKPMGNGHPIGAIVTTSEIAASFDHGPEFFSSFGGNPVSCAIGEAVLDVIEEERLQQKAKTVGNFLKSGLEELGKRYAEIADVRGSGMFLGVELLDLQGKPYTELANHLKNELRENFILIGTDGPFDNVLKIKPPLSFNENDARILLDRMTSIMENRA